jgi:propionate CoA-transferase
MTPRIISAEEAVKKIQNGASICIGGGGAGHAVPDKILEKIGEAYLEKKSPRRLTVIHPCGIGDNENRGLNHLAHEGLVKRLIGGFWGNAPKMVQLAQEEKVEGYNFPQGVLAHLMRATAAGCPGVITTTGLFTFVDPRVEGGKINKRTTEDLVDVILINQKKYLLYKTIPFSVAIIRGTSIDKNGNLTMENEVATFSMLSIAQAAKVNGGIVIAQVQSVSDDKAAMPERVKVPGSFIDYVVVEPDQGMTFLTKFDQSMIDHEAPSSETLYVDGIKKVIARRAAMEINPGMYLNVGYGMADGVPVVVKAEGMLDKVTFLIEQGAAGGIPTTGLNFGAMFNPHAILDDGYQFDFIHGRGLDVAFLGFAQIDQQGNVNSSKFGSKLTGCGGFIDISQNAKRIIFCGAFAVKGVIHIEDGSVQVVNPGIRSKFAKQVEQITFSGNYALDQRQPVLIVTERAVFELVRGNLVLKEAAPGVDVKKHILDLMDFQPIVPPFVELMSQKCFSDTPLYTFE